MESRSVPIIWSNYQRTEEYENKVDNFKRNADWWNRWIDYTNYEKWWRPRTALDDQKVQGNLMQAYHSLPQPAAILWRYMEKNWHTHTFQGLEGVYAHRERATDKAGNCMVFAPIPQDRQVEVLCGPIRPGSTRKACGMDQRVQKGSSVKLIAFRICVRRSGELQDGASVTVIGFQGTDPHTPQLMEHDYAKRDVKIDQQTQGGQDDIPFVLAERGQWKLIGESGQTSKFISTSRRMPMRTTTGQIRERR